MSSSLRARLSLLAALCLPQLAPAQAWRESVAQLGGSARVLLIGTRPEDADNALLAFLGRGRGIEMGYLSLTRGEAGANVIGAERGPTLAVVRTAEVLAERQRDGARQYFTRAFDFGAVEADSVVAAAWPRDSLLADVVSVIRAFRPQVVIALTTTVGERDATRRLTATLVADAVAAAGDTAILSSLASAELGGWRVARLYALADTVTDASRVLPIDVGAFDPRELRSYAEIGAETRRLQRSQPPRAAPTAGPLVRRLQRMDRADDDMMALFAPRDTALARFDAIVPAAARPLFDSLRAQLADVTRLAQHGSADSVAARLARLAVRAQVLGRALECRTRGSVPTCAGPLGDLAMFVVAVRERATRAMLEAAGIVIDGVVARELVAPGDTVPLTITLRNGGTVPVQFRSVLPFHQNGSAAGDVAKPLMLAPDSLAQLPSALMLRTISRQWWQMFGLQSGTQLHLSRDPTRSQLIRGEDRLTASGVTAPLTIGGVEVPVTVGPLVARAPTALRGDMRHPVIGVAETSLLFERGAEYERAGMPVSRVFRVFVQSARSSADTVQVTLTLPAGLRADSAVRVVALPPFGSRNIFFALRGTLSPGPQVIEASARSVRALPAQAIGAPQTAALTTFTLGTVINDYPHIPSQHFVRFARDRVESVALRVPPRLRIGYVRGSEDVRSALSQLRLSVTPIDIGLLPAYDLTGITTLLLGTGVLRGETSLASVPALQDFLVRGGTVVVLGGGAEIARSGLYPFPIGTELAPGRSAADSADVRVPDARSPLLTWPNAITNRDFAAWNGDRTCSRATLVDPRYAVALGVVDGAGKPTAPAVISARVGKGTLVHTTLCIGPELEGARSGAARLLVNLLSAGQQGRP